MIRMPQIFPCVYALLQQNSLAMQGREEVAITPQCHQCCGMTACFLCCVHHQEKGLSYSPMYLCRQPFNLHRTSVCEQQSLSPPSLPVTRLVPHLSRCLGGPASDKHSQQQKTHCWHICEKHVGKGDTAGSVAPSTAIAARMVSSFQRKISSRLYDLKVYKKLLFYSKFQFQVSAVSYYLIYHITEHVTEAVPFFQIPRSLWNNLHCKLKQLLFYCLKHPFQFSLSPRQNNFNQKNPLKTNKWMKGHEYSKITMQVYFGNPLGRVIWKLLSNELLPSFQGYRS